VRDTGKERKRTGALGERIACAYLRRHGFSIRATNVRRKTGELDIVACKGDTLHVVEVKTVVCEAFPTSTREDTYDPSDNLHPYKIRKVARTAEWYVMDTEWEGEWQIDGALVWLRGSDGRAKVRYLPQIV
jgi:putative endonuclease